VSQIGEVIKALSVKKPEKRRKRERTNP